MKTQKTSQVSQIAEPDKAPEVSDENYQPPSFDSNPTAQIRSYAEFDDLINMMIGEDPDTKADVNALLPNPRYIETIEKVNAFYRDQADEWLDVMPIHVDRAILLLSFHHTFGDCRGPIGGDASQEHTLTECIHSHLVNWERQFASMRYNNNNSYRWTDKLLEAIPEMAEVYAERARQMDCYFSNGHIAKSLQTAVDNHDKAMTNTKES